MVSKELWQGQSQKLVSKTVTKSGHFEVIMKRDKKESGFSLIELLLVVVVIGIIAAVAIPAYQKSKQAAENGSTFAIMRTIGSTQVTFFSQNNRFGTLPELQKILNNSIGTTVVDKVFRGTYVYELASDPVDLPTEYVITATRSIPGETVFTYEINQAGKIRQVLPAGAPEN